MRKELAKYSLAFRCAWNNLGRPFLKSPSRPREAICFSGLAMSALDYLGYQQNRNFCGDVSRKAVERILRLGKLINDYYDLGRLDSRNYIAERRALKRNGGTLSDYLFYRKQISRLEKARPIPPACGNEGKEKIFRYREQTNLVSLAMACVAGLGLNFEDLIDTEDLKIAENAPVWFEGLFSLVMALQVVDDWVGWRGDLGAKRPSFFTAFIREDISPEEISPERLKEIFVLMNKKGGDYLSKAHEIFGNDPLYKSTDLIVVLLPLVFKWTEKRSEKFKRLFFTNRDIKNL